MKESNTLGKTKATLINNFEGHKGAIYTLECGSKPHLFYSGSFDNMVVEWDLTKPQKNRAIAKLPEKAFSLKYVHEKKLLLIGNFSGGVHVIDLETNKETKLLKYHKAIIFDIQYVPEKQWFYVMSADGSYSVWDINNYDLITTQKLGEQKLRSIDFCKSRNEAAIGYGDGTIRIIDIDTFKEKNVLKGHMENFSVSTVKFDPTGNYLLSGSRDAHLNIWDINNDYKLIERIPAHYYAIYSIVFSPDGKLFATGSRDKTIKIWNPKKSKPLLTINLENHQGHTHSVNKLIWSNYNDYLISTGDDCAIKVWEISM